MTIWALGSGKLVCKVQNNIQEKRKKNQTQDGETGIQIPGMFAAEWYNRFRFGSEQSEKLIKQPYEFNQEKTQVFRH